MKLNLKRVLAVIKKEFSQIRRDKRTIAIIIMNLLCCLITEKL